MKIYLASSWRNKYQPTLVQVLRGIGYDVYDFRNPTEGDNGFSWRQITDEPPERWSAEKLVEVLGNPIARRGFDLDMNALRGCDVCVLFLPCGRSAHLELGWAAGAGKKTFVLLDNPISEPELMYLMCTKVCASLDDLKKALKEIE